MRSLPSARVGPFVAHYYLALNGFSLIVQLLLTGAVIRRIGVLPALLVTPLLLVGGAGVVFAGGVSLLGVLLVKGIDGSLRYSMHRATAELMYLPVPPKLRRRTKPLIDGGLARAAQTLTGAALFAMGGTTWIGPRPLAGIVAVLGVAWLATVVTMRRPYLRLLRSAITNGSFDGSENQAPIDMETAQLLVQRLASEDPLEVEGAMTALARRERGGIVPALVLLHGDQGVLVQALEMFGASKRSDWYALARRLSGDRRESVRVAAARALARHEQLDASSLANDVGWRARGYAAVRAALGSGSTDVNRHSAVAPLLDQTGEPGALAKLGMLAAIIDAQPTPRLFPLLRRLAWEPATSLERTKLVAGAAARQRDLVLVPHLVSCLSVRAGREAVRSALVALGDPALEEVWRTLSDPLCARRLRIHMPKTLARFATRRAGERLLHQVETEQDGLIRYKALRALRILATDYRIRVDRERVEELCRGDLEKHFRLLGLVRVFDAPDTRHDAITSLLLELLSEKGRHALDRAFQLLQIAHPREGVRRAYVACRSEDPFVRATAAEFLDALTQRRAQRRLRALLALATDDLSLEDRVERARALVASMVTTREQALEALVHGHDPMLVGLVRRVRSLRGAPPASSPGIAIEAREVAGA